MPYQSRVRRFGAKETRKQVIKYLFLSILFVGAMIKWGLPNMIRLLSADRGGIVEEQVDDNLPLQEPTLAALPEATPSGEIKVEGWAQAGLKIRLLVNDLLVDEKTSDGEGKFEFTGVRLKLGENKIGVQAVSETGKESRIVEAIVSMDNVLPTLEVLEPAEESQFYGKEQQNLILKGKTDDGETKVTVNGNFVAVANDGNFSYRMRLNEGVNELVIVAVDKAGNRMEKLFRVNFSL